MRNSSALFLNGDPDVLEARRVKRGARRENEGLQGLGIGFGWGVASLGSLIDRTDHGRRVEVCHSPNC